VFRLCHGNRFYGRWRLWDSRHLHFLQRRGRSPLRLTPSFVQLDDRLSDLHVIALTNEEAGNSSSGGRRHGHGGFFGLQLDERLSLAHLIALAHQQLDNVAAFDTFRKKWELDVHVIFLKF
jgi:hypothetical protein